MALAFITATIVLVVLLSVLALPHLRMSLVPRLLVMLSRVRSSAPQALLEGFDPGRELRAEQRARTLLRSCINEEEWDMYNQLGFLRVWGTLPPRPRGAHGNVIPLRWMAARASRSPLELQTAGPYAYLIYPHKPILACIPHTGAVLGEYCIEFPDHSRPYGSSRLPDADDVLAKWVALNAEEQELIERANMHLPGRQIRLAEARRDLLRLSSWERQRLRSQERGLRHAGSVRPR
jgi:hypothetical protein